MAREPAFAVDSILEAAQRLGNRHAPIVEVEPTVSAGDAACQTVHRDIFERMQDDERPHDGGRVRDPEGRGHNWEASQEGQEAREPARGHDGEHWDHKQYMADT